MRIISAKDKLRERILRLEQGFPQNWIYVEREVAHPLRETTNDGVRASSNFVGGKVSEIFQKDLVNVNNFKITNIRAVVGPNGAGKTTLLKYQVEEKLKDIAPNKHLYLFFDFKGITDEINEFWSIFIQNLIDQLTQEEDNKLERLLNNINRRSRKSKLIRVFKNKALVDNLIKLTSPDEDEQSNALMYFYGDLDAKSIADFYYGLLQIAFDLNFIVVVGYDELQFLNEIDRSQKLLKLFLEKFIRHLMEVYSKNRLYILISCLENPQEKEWTKLRAQSKNFDTIVDKKEIILGNLTSTEKDKIITQVADEIGFKEKERKLFFQKVKNSLFYYVPRELLRCIANVIDSMDYTYHTDFEIHKIYEFDAREYMVPRLKEKGFPYIEKDVTKVGGFDMDIYATRGTNRSAYIPKALGEVSMINRKSSKGKVEKFANWLHRMRGREYNPDRGDYAFFVCPPNHLTEGAKKVLEDNGIEVIYFTSLNLEQIMQVEASSKESEVPEQEEVMATPPIVCQKAESKPEGAIMKTSKYSLEDVPDIGPAKRKALNDSGIHTIKDLLKCNVKFVASNTKGVGVSSLNKWKQNARQILEN